MSETPSLVQIKGLRDGLLVTLGDAPWPDLKTALLAQIDGQPSFFQTARMALDVGNQVLRVAELTALRDQLSERGISLWAVLSNSPTTERTAQILGLATRISKPRPQETRPAEDALDEKTGLWLQQTLRSGTRIEYSGNVIVLGDVNPGAEIVAQGSVLVWGRLRGAVHAGSEGDKSAVVGALELSPTQLRIAGEIATPPQREGKPKPEMARLKNGQLLTEPWKPG